MRHREALSGLGAEERLQQMAEIVVRAAVDNVKNSAVMQEVWSSGRRVMVHGWMYDVKTGAARELGVHASGVQDADLIYQLRLPAEHQ